MRQAFEIPGRLDGLNTYTSANRTNPYAGAKMKKSNQEAVMWAIKAAKLEPMEAVTVHITWIEPNMRRDPDNIRFGAKFILDALVQMGVIPNDTQKYVRGISDRFMVNKSNPRIIVELEEA